MVALWCVVAVTPGHVHNGYLLPNKALQLAHPSEPVLGFGSMRATTLSSAWLAVSRRHLSAHSVGRQLRGRTVRIALFSDIHGNDVALEAVLRDIEQSGGVDQLGPSPLRVLDILSELRSARVIRGNTDRYVFSGIDRPPPSIEEASLDASSLPALVECAGTFAWTQGLLSTTHWIEWLEELPLQIREELPDGTRALAVHAAPGCDDGRGLLAGSSQDELLAIVDGCNADLVFGGHHHMPLDERIGAFHLVNLGSVSNPYAPDLRASYVLLDCDRNGYTVRHRRVDYDRESVIERMRELRHPGSSYVIAHLSGARRPPVSSETER